MCWKNTEFLCLKGGKKETPEKKQKSKFILEDSSIPLDQEIHSFSNEEARIFEKYGVHIDPHKQTTCREVRELFEDSELADLPAIDDVDISVLKKYGISPAPYAQKPEDHGLFVTDALLALIRLINPRYVLMLLGVILLFYLAGYMFTAYRNYQQHCRLVADYENKLATFSDYRQKVLQKKEAVEQTLQALSEKFPPRLGYPETNPKILLQLQEVQKKANAINSIMLKAQEQREMDELKESLAWLESQKSKLETGVFENLDTLHRKVERTLTVATQFHEIRQREAFVRKTLRTLREHVVGFSQKIKPSY